MQKKHWILAYVARKAGQGTGPCPEGQQGAAHISTLTWPLSLSWCEEYHPSERVCGVLGAIICMAMIENRLLLPLCYHKRNEGRLILMRRYTSFWELTNRICSHIFQDIAAFRICSTFSLSHMIRVRLAWALPWRENEGWNPRLSSMQEEKPGIIWSVLKKY